MKASERLSVRQVFERAAPNYDRMNDLMSGGLHRIWKRILIDMIPRTPSGWLVDIASGTGDIAFGALAQQQSLRALLCDPNDEMMALARRNLTKQSLSIQQRAHLIQSHGEALPFSDRAVDHCVISFGIRNIEDKQACLDEMFRIMRFGGRLLCLEFSPVILPALQGFYNFYSDRVIPRLARMMNSEEAPYRYLVESIRNFPPPEGFAKMVEAAGFSKTRFINLTGGIAVIYSAFRV